MSYDNKLVVLGLKWAVPNVTSWKASPKSVYMVQYSQVPEAGQVNREFTHKSVIVNDTEVKLELQPNSYYQIMVIIII